MALPFSIVKFPEEDTTAVVPTSWFEKKTNLCKYPPKSASQKVDRLVKNAAVAEENWPSYSAAIIKNYRTYEAARLDLKRSEDTSNLESEEEDEISKRKRIPNRQLFYPGEDTDEEGKNVSAPFFPNLNTFKENHNPTTLYHEHNHTPVLTDISNNKHFSQQSTHMFTDQPPSNELTQHQHQITPTHPHIQTTPHTRILTNNQFQSILQIPAIHTPNLAKDSTHHQQTSPIYSDQHRPWTETSQIKQISNGDLWQGIIQLQSSMVDLSNMMKTLDEKVDMCIGRNGTLMANESDEQCQLLGMMPLSSMEDFTKMETGLKENKALKASIVKIFCSFGGRDERTLVLNVLKRLMTDSLATCFSYTGKKGIKVEKTIPFGPSEICKNVIAAVTKSFPKATEDTLKKQVMMFLNQARTRIARKEQGNYPHHSEPQS